MSRKYIEVKEENWKKVRRLNIRDEREKRQLEKIKEAFEDIESKSALKK